MTDYSTKISDKAFKQSVPVRLTNKQVRKISKTPTKGEENCPLMLFYEAFKDNSKELDVNFKNSEERYMVTPKTYELLRSQVTKWMLKEVSYLSKDSRGLESQVGMFMLNYSPMEASHKDMEDNVVYFLKEFKGKINE